MNSTFTIYLMALDIESFQEIYFKIQINETKADVKDQKDRLHRVSFV